MQQTVRQLYLAQIFTKCKSIARDFQQFIREPYLLQPASFKCAASDSCYARRDDYAFDTAAALESVASYGSHFISVDFRRYNKIAGDGFVAPAYRSLAAERSIKIRRVLFAEIYVSLYSDHVSFR